MRIATLLAVTLAVLAVPAGAQAPPAVPAQAGRVIAVADFANVSVDSGLVPQAHLTDLLRRLLEQRLPAPTRIIAGERVRAAMRARGYTHEDLVYPSRMAEIAQAVGADWVITGTWTQLRAIGRGTPESPGPPAIRHGDAFAIADVEIRVLDASSRRRLLEERFSGRAPGGDLGSVILAATEALREAAGRIARL